MFYGPILLNKKQSKPGMRMAQEHMLYKHKDLSLNTQHPSISFARPGVTETPELECGVR